MAKKLNIQKGDEVLVVAGKDRTRGAKGKVLQVFPDRPAAIVEGVNIIKRHTRPNPQKGVQGGIVDRPAPIHVSNLMVICPSCGKPSRLGRKRLDDGSGVRVCKSCDTVLS